MVKRQPHMPTWKFLYVLIALAFMWVIFSSINVGKYLRTTSMRSSKFVRANVNTYKTTKLAASNIVTNRNRYRSAGNTSYREALTSGNVAIRRSGGLYSAHKKKKVADTSSQMEAGENPGNPGNQEASRKSVTTLPESQDEEKLMHQKNNGIPLANMKADVMILNTTATPRHTLCKKFELLKGIDLLPGKDIKSVPNVSLSACCNLCSKHGICGGFSFVHSSGNLLSRCWLKPRPKRGLPKSSFLVLSKPGVYMTSGVLSEVFRLSRSSMSGSDGTATISGKKWNQEPEEEDDVNVNGKCVMPKMDPWDPTMKALFAPRLHKCPRPGNLDISMRHEEHKPSMVDCKLEPVLFQRDTYPQHKFGVHEPADGYLSRKPCKRTKRYRFEWHVHRKKDVLARYNALPDHLKHSKEYPELQIFMLSHDSTSFSEYTRTMAKSRSTLESMGAIFFSGHSIVGDGTTANVAAVHTGYSELHSGEPGYPLHEARRGYAGSSFLDDWPWIGNEMKKRGFATAGHFGSRQDIGAFSMRLHGFKKPPFDHYMIPLFSALSSQNLWGDATDFCFDGVTQEMFTVNFATEFFQTYKDVPSFFYGHLAGVHHTEIESGAAAMFDQPFEAWLRHSWDHHKKQDVNNNSQQGSAGKMKDAFMFLLGDHGKRNGRQSPGMVRRLEERNPVLAILVPAWFEKAFPNLVAVARANAMQRRITSPYDVHATLRHIMYLVGSHDPALLEERKRVGSWSTSKHHRSLFESIPENRTCSEAEIPAHFCTCHKWKRAVPSAYQMIKKAANTFVDWANNRMKNELREGKLFPENSCASLSLQGENKEGAGGGIMEAFTLVVKHREMTSVKRTTDRHGRQNKIQMGRHEKWDENNPTHLRLFLLTEAHHPESGKVIRSNMRFEVLLEKKTQDKTYTVSSALRSDTYGNDPACIAEQHPFLRKFCVCTGK